MMAKNEVFLANLPRLSARRNLLTVSTVPALGGPDLERTAKNCEQQSQHEDTPSSPVSLNRKQLSPHWWCGNSKWHFVVCHWLRALHWFN